MMNGFGKFWIIWIIITGILLWIAMHFSNKARRNNKALKSDSLEILKEKFAKGEISEVEYNKLRKKIK